MYRWCRRVEVMSSIDITYSAWKTSSNLQCLCGTRGNLVWGRFPQCWHGPWVNYSSKITNLSLLVWRRLINFLFSDWNHALKFPCDPRCELFVTMWRAFWYGILDICFWFSSKFAHHHTPYFCHYLGLITITL